MRSVSFSHSQTICHILQHYTWRIYPSDRRKQLSRIFFQICTPSHLLSPLLTSPIPRPRSTRSSSSPKQISSHGYKNQEISALPVSRPLQIPNLKFQTFSDRSYTTQSSVLTVPILFPHYHFLACLLIYLYSFNPIFHYDFKFFLFFCTIVN